MEILVKSNDPVYLSWIRSILSSHNINFYIMDEEMSVMEGNITAIPVRILVDEDQISIARKVLTDELKVKDLMESDQE